MKVFHSHFPFTVICLLHMATLGATPLPQAQPVHIEIRHGYGASRLMYFWLTDLYTKEERKVKSEFIGGDTEVLDFELYHPLYAEIIPSGNQKQHHHPSGKEWKGSIV